MKRSNSVILSSAISGYSCFARLADIYLQALLLLVFRLHWGGEFFFTGKGKLLNHEQVVGFFTELGIPLPGLNAWFVGGVECIGGLMLFIGLCSRPVALILSINMLVAYLSVAEDRTKLLSVIQDPDPFLTADPFFFLLTSVLVLAFGAGSISADRLIARFFKKFQMSR